MGEKLLIALIAFSGVALGILASGTSYFWKLRERKLKLLKSVLFKLLDLRKTIYIASINPNQFYLEYVGYCEAFYTEKCGSEFKILAEYSSLIQKHFKELLSHPESTEKWNSQSKALNDSIGELSYYYPLTAFYISDLDNLKVIFEMQHKYTDSALELLNSELTGEDFEIILKELDEAYEKSITPILKDVDNKVLTIAKSCKSQYLNKTKKILSKNEHNKIDFKQMGLDEILEQFIDNLETQDQRL